jgi:hypothetical protein
MKKMSIALERHSSEVCANQLVLLACSYKFHVQHCTMCYTTMLGITWTQRWLGDGSAEVDQSLGLLGRQI